MYQCSHILVHKDGRVYYTWLIEPGTALRYPREMLTSLLRSGASFRYTQVAALIFSLEEGKEGVVLQQNPASMQYFG